MHFHDIQISIGDGHESLGVGLFVALMAVLGGVIGSFLNVVVYRLPRGISLSYPASRCPRCGHPIRWRDNVPVLGWLLLGGKCRDCRAPISVRYPLVELTVAAMFGAFAWLEVVEGGINLPDRALRVSEQPPPQLISHELQFPGGGSLRFDSAWSATSIPGQGLLPLERYAFHMLLLAGLLAMALIARDNQAIPRRLWAPMLVVGFTLPIAWPLLRPVPLSASIDASRAAPWWIGFIDGLGGLATGVLLGICQILYTRASAAVKSSPPGAAGDRSGAQLAPEAKMSARPMLTTVAVFLGAASACWVAAGACVGMLLLRLCDALRPGHPPRSIAMPMFVATVALLLVFRWASQAFAGLRWDLGLLTVLVALGARRWFQTLRRARQVP